MGLVFSSNAVDNFYPATLVYFLTGDNRGFIFADTLELSTVKHKSK